MDRITSTSVSGFGPKSWGPLVWSVLHIISLNYPVEPDQSTRNMYGIWFEHFINVLPCGTCIENIGVGLKELKYTRDIHLKSRESFAKFIFDLHAHVNRTLGQHDYSVRFEDVCTYYEQLRNTKEIRSHILFTVEKD
jgi:hypothetical protein